MRGTALVLGFGGIAAAVSAVGVSLAGDDDASDPAKVFGGRCATCHTVPQPSLAGDRAWTLQVRDTA